MSFPEHEVRSPVELLPFKVSPRNATLSLRIMIMDTLITKVSAGLRTRIMQDRHEIDYFFLLLLYVFIFAYKRIKKNYMA